MNNPVTRSELGKPYPELSSDRLDITRFFSKEYFEKERERVFGRTWLMLAREDELPNPGDYVVKDLEVCRTSILLVRGKDRKVRGFHNMCTHRGNNVAYGRSGNTKAFACGFHGWVYDLEGRLADVPAEKDIFPGLKKDCLGLTPVLAEPWEGFIFVNLDVNTQEDLRAFLGDLVDGFQGMFKGQVQAVRYNMDVRANWKICLDAFAETYHFPTVHKISAGRVVTSKSNPFGFLDAARLYDKHRVASARANKDMHPTPTETLVAKVGGHQTLNPDFTHKRALPPAVNPGGFDDWVSDVFVLFPMAVIQPNGGGSFFLTQNFWPLSHERTRYEATFYMDPAANAGGWLAQEYNAVFFRDVLREDWVNMENIQSNLESGAKKEFIFGDQELLLKHSYAVLRRMVGE